MFERSRELWLKKMLNKIPPTIAELHSASRFRLVETFKHGALIPALRKYMWAPTLVTFAYVAVNVAAVGMICLALFRSALPVADRFSHVGVGFLLGYLALLPLHEHLHAAVYRLFGSSSVKVHYKLRRLIAYCIADRFVVTGQQLVWVALAPLLLINAALLALFVAAPAGQTFISGALLMHTGGCSGDIALVNLVWLNRQRQVWTYDDAGAMESHFFVD